MEKESNASSPAMKVDVFIFAFDPLFAVNPWFLGSSSDSLFGSLQPMKFAPKIVPRKVAKAAIPKSFVALALLLICELFFVLDLEFGFIVFLLFCWI